MEKIKPTEGQLAIRAYCSKCGKMLMESCRLTKKQLYQVWDKSVIQAVQIKCEDCGHKFPNFYLNLRIVNVKLNKEYKPTEYIHAKNKQKPEELFKSISQQWLREHPEVKEPTSQEVAQALNDIRNGEERADTGGN